MNGTLYVSKVAEEDEGKFICEADNGVNEPIGKLVSLKVNGEDECIDFEVPYRPHLQKQCSTYVLPISAPPKFDVAHAGPVTGRTGETLELVCEAAGDDHIKYVMILIQFLNESFVWPKEQIRFLSQIPFHLVKPFQNDETLNHIKNYY